MATELTVQSERAYQKQPHIFVNQKVKRTKSTRVGKGGRRWYKDVGLGFRTPKTAIEGTYIGMTSIVMIRSFSLNGSDCGRQTRNAHLPAKSPSAAVFLQALSSPPKCTALSSFAANTFTLSLNTPDTRSATKILPRTSHQLSVWRKVIRSQSDNAVL